MLLRHTVFNLFGLGLPLVVAVFTIPLLIEALGTARFGLLALIWAIVSYFGLFDFGLGRTLTLQMAVAESRGERDRIGPNAATALTVMAALGLCVGAFLVVGAQPAIDLIAEVPDRGEAIAALVAMGVAIPAITLTAGFRGMLEARHAFGIVNLIRIPMGVYTFVGPLVVIWLLEPRLDLIAWVLVAGRYVALVAHAVLAFQMLPPERGPFRFRARLLAPLLSIGGWLTVSNVVSPLMGYADRFLIGALVSATAVAYYATPYEIVTKLWIIPGALTSVLFPTFAAQIARSASAGATLMSDSVAALALAMLPVCAGLAIFAHEILELWINAEFARNSAPLLQIFAVGIFVNSLAHIPFTLVQAAGKPKWTALVHLIQVVPFIALLWWATSQFGLLGAAFAWLTRIAFDTCAMFYLGWAVEKTPTSSVTLAAKPVLLAAFATALLLVESIQLRLVGFGVLTLASIVFFCCLPAIRTRARKIF
jgi:O-antigen/teichoic acid export membrane protein